MSATGEAVSFEKQIKPMFREGDRLGFRKTNDGRILAVAGEEEFELHDLPATASRFCWYHRTSEPSQFARNVTGAFESMNSIVTMSAAGVSEQAAPTDGTAPLCVTVPCVVTVSMLPGEAVLP